MTEQGVILNRLLDKYENSHPAGYAESRKERAA